MKRSYATRFAVALPVNYAETSANGWKRRLVASSVNQKYWKAEGCNGGGAPPPRVSQGSHSVFAEQIQEKARGLNPSTALIYMLASCLFLFALVATTANAGPSLGLQTDIVSDQAEPGSFRLATSKQAAPIFLDQADWPGVLCAGADLQADIERVTGIKPALTTNTAPAGKFAVIIGTLGKSSLIDGLVKPGKLNVTAISVHRGEQNKMR